MMSVELTPTQPIPKKSQQIKTDKPRPHICTICTRAFARLEHLKRHERSHTNEKPFQCASCGRCFARRDLVLRHQQKLHSELGRRNSEDIIVLRNNTNANAPLTPNGINTTATSATSTTPSTATVTSIGSKKDKKDKKDDSIFKTYLFDLNTPPNSNSNSILFPINHSPDIFNSNSKFESKFEKFPRHQSFSAVLSNSYTKDFDPYNLDMNLDYFEIKSTKPQQQQNQQSNQQHQNQQLQSQHQNQPHKQLQQQNHLQQQNYLLNLGEKKRKLDDLSPTGHPLSRSHSNPNPITTSTTINPPLQNGNPGTGGSNVSGMSSSPYNHSPHHFSVPSTHSMPGVIHETPEDDIQTPNVNNVNGNNNGINNGINVNGNGNNNGNINNNGNGKGNNNNNVNNGNNVNSINNINNVNKVNNGNNNNSNNDGNGGNGIEWLQEFIHTPYESNFFDDPVDEISSLFKNRQSDLSKSFTDLNFNDIDMYLPVDIMPEMLIPTATNNYKDQPPQQPQQPNQPNQQQQPQQQLHHQQQIHQQLPQQLSQPPMHQIHPMQQPTPIHQMYDQKPQQQSDNGNGNGTGTGQGNNSNNGNNGGHSANYYPYINEELRNRIIIVSNLSDLQFPSLDELNNYMKLYEKEFNKYFPFIHLPSLKNPMVDNNENIPLLLSMSSIGALYSYHDSNTLLLFNLSKYHIQNFFEKEVTLDNLQFKKVPLMAHQCLVLHIFISMFLNEPPMIDITSRQMKSMVGLIKSTNFHKPLENFLIPPTSIESDEDGRLVQNNFDYFIMCQSRIRTIFVFYLLQQFRTSTLLDLNILLNAENINCGIFSFEHLWKCDNSIQWYNELVKNKLIKNDIGGSGGLEEDKFLIIQLSNNNDMKNIINNLNNFKSLKIGFNNCLYLLIYCHERIQQSYNDLKNDFMKFDYINWRLKNNNLKNLLLSWEMTFNFNGGNLLINETNNNLFNEFNEFKLILPLYYFAKIKIAVNLTPIIERIVYKDWENMNKYLNNLNLDFDGLKESIEYSLDIMNLWNQNISVVNDLKENNLRTPVFFVTCVFVSLLLILQFLYQIENDSSKLGITEKVLWLKCEKILKISEKILSLNSTSMEDYENYESIRKLIESNGNEKLILNSLKLIKLSNKCLFLGVRILADAPIWPLAMGFAEALKNRANYISKI